MAQRLQTILLVALLFGAAEGLLDARSAVAEVCPVTFGSDPPLSGDNSQLAVADLYAEARDNFARWTRKNASGDREKCDASSHNGCWMYRQPCFNHVIHVEGMNRGHLHLSFEDPAIGACFVDPGDGYGVGMGRTGGNTCVAPDWGKEPRRLASHDTKHWIKIWLEDNATHTPSTFGMVNIANTVSGWNTPIQLWFKKSDGTWWYWANLGPNKNWKISQWVQDVTEVRIRSGQSVIGDFESFAIEGFWISEP